MLFSVSQHVLHDVAFELHDHRGPGFSLFPFFDGEGRTHAFMLTDDRSGRITLVDFERDLFQRRGRPLLRRPHRLGLRLADLRDSEPTTRSDLADLWHFDPWWELAEARYYGHAAVPALKSTNLAGFDETLSRVWFDRTLGRVTWLGFGEGEEMKLRRFRPELLAAAGRERAERSTARPFWESGPDAVAGAWRLRPFWSRGPN